MFIFKLLWSVFLEFWTNGVQSSKIQATFRLPTGISFHNWYKDAKNVTERDYSLVWPMGKI